MRRLALREPHGVRPIPQGLLLNALVQIPVFGALYSAIQRGASALVGVGQAALLRGVLRRRA